MTLGCKRLSTLVQEQCEISDETLDPGKSSDMREFLLDRLALFLHECNHAKPKVSIASLSASDNFKVKICEKLSISKTLVVGDSKIKRSQPGSAGAKKDDQGHIELWLSNEIETDMYE